MGGEKGKVRGDAHTQKFAKVGQRLYDPRVIMLLLITPMPEGYAGDCREQSSGSYSNRQRRFASLCISTYTFKHSTAVECR